MGFAGVPKKGPARRLAPSLRTPVNPKIRAPRSNPHHIHPKPPTNPPLVCQATGFPMYQPTNLLGVHPEVKRDLPPGVITPCHLPPVLSSLLRARPFLHDFLDNI